MRNIWQYRGAEQTDLPKDILDACDGSPLLAKLLLSRGVKTPQEIRAFVNLHDYQPTSGWELPDARAAVDRIVAAIENQEHILIFGDFDVDGITGTSVLYEALKLLDASVSYYIPDRATEGHGLNSAALLRLTSTRKVRLVVSTDTGITNFAEVSLLNGLKVDTVITDHHALPENLPPAVANVNPQRLDDQHPLKLLAGVGVAYKLCELLFETLLPPDHAREAADSLLDLTAIGTVVDMVPLLRENRYLVYRGLQILNRRERLGICEILTQSLSKNADPNATLTSETLGFTIGPRLNAVGRLDKADQAVELLTTDDPERARQIASHIEHLNRRRRDLCDQTYLEAESHLNARGGLDDQRAIVLGSPDWNPGIIGIVASRLIEKYHVPVFMMVIDESKGQARCSARSIPGFNMHDCMVALSHYFEHFGGHAGAGGFALKLEKLEAFKRDLYALTGREISDEQMRPIVEVDAKLQWTQINPHLVEMVGKLAPFGMANPSPRFVVENVKVAAQRALGEEGRHLKLVLTPAGKAADAPIEALIWNHGPDKFNTFCTWNFVVQPELNTFNGAVKVQLIVEDFLSPDEESPAKAMVTLKPTEQRAAVGSPVHAVKLNQSGAPQGNGSGNGAGENPMQWIDHRSRDSVESFIGQLMLPLQDRRKVIIYHEGRKPDIPFLDESLLCDRRSVKPAEELILWDLPPSLAHFRAILDWVKPEVVHLIGGKYQSVPVFPAEQNFLKVILQAIRKQLTDSGEAVVSVDLDSFAVQLAATTPVITTGLVLLGRLGLLESTVIPAAGKDDVSIRLLQPTAGIENAAKTIEYLAFRQALKETGKFRNWLLSEPLDKIRATLLSDHYQYYANKEETIPHAHVTSA